MKTNTWHGRRFGLLARVGIAAVTLAFAASGFAQPNADRAGYKNRAVRAEAARKGCFVVLSSSPFPQPCERLSATPSTATPMVIIGEAPPMRKFATR
jgi:hypothetical protein